MLAHEYSAQLASARQIEIERSFKSEARGKEPEGVASKFREGSQEGSGAEEGRKEWHRFVLRQCFREGVSDTRAVVRSASQLVKSEVMPGRIRKN